MKGTTQKELETEVAEILKKLDKKSDEETVQWMTDLLVDELELKNVSLISTALNYLLPPPLRPEPVYDLEDIDIEEEIKKVYNFFENRKKVK